MPDPKDRFYVDPTLATATQCSYCVHREGPDCPAFGGKIPDDIILNEFDHRTAHPAEVEPIRFTPRPGIDADVMNSLASDMDRFPKRG